MATKKKESEPRPTMLLAYAGARPWLKGRKVGHVYVKVTEDWEREPLPEVELEGDLALFGKKLGSWTRPGHVVSVEYDSDEDGSVFPSTATVVGSYPDEVCAEWGIEHHTVEAAARIEKEAKKDGTRDFALEQLAPFQRAYKQLRNKQERAVFLGRVMDYITRGSGL